MEGRKPALVDSFWQALLTAPFFVWFEVLFVLGYAPATRAELQKRVDAEIAKFKASSSTVATGKVASSDADATTTASVATTAATTPARRSQRVSQRAD